MKLTWFSLYNLILSLWVGGIAIFTFIVTPAIFRSFGRDTASSIVDKLFPGYFLYTLVLSALAFVLFFTVSGDQSGRAARISFMLLVTAVLINVIVAFKIHPDAVKLKRQIVSFEQEAAGSPARKAFKRLHAVSAALNLLVLADGVVLLLVSPALRK